MSEGRGTSTDSAIRSAGIQNDKAALQLYQPLSQECVIASEPHLIFSKAVCLRNLCLSENVWQMQVISITKS
ncbi:hemin ABC transporter substrate-binding protein, partial [Erwinia amylovora]|nr:hemin ABC transporter substrate-binding protein [Erwinia amylovora]